MIGMVIALFFIYEKEIVIQLESGRYKNSKNRNIEQRLQSIANVTTDASNTERFNRWASAMRMFNEKPFFGCGPEQFFKVCFPQRRCRYQAVLKNGLKINGCLLHDGKIVVTEWIQS